MKQITCYLFISFFGLFLHAQSVNGIIRDASTRELLAGASISVYKSGHVEGIVSNKEGKFIIPADASFDSVKCSMVGYRSAILYSNMITGKNFIEIKLEESPSILAEVLVKPPSAIEIIKQAISKISSFQPENNFESNGFYREIIKDKEQYFSVAEALFKAQYFPAKQSYKLKLDRGRSKEDVGYTRLFEDYHPGGGPQVAADNSFIVRRPDFLNLKKINYFNYKIVRMIQSDDRQLYCIGFDQKPGIKEALEKGRIYIDADDFAVVRYEAENSPIGMPYVKNLTGTDKIFAEILNIEFRKKVWKRSVDFSRQNDKWLLSHADVEFEIGYAQPKKNIDLDLTINIELLMTDLQLPFTKEITKDEEWKRKNLAMNLPSAFDSSYWGNNNIISPTEQVNQIIAAISKNNHDTSIATSIDGWQYLNRNYFISYLHNDTIILTPLMKSLWEEDQTSGMMYKNMDGDFSVELKINIAKSSDANLEPDKGFQQAGIIIRRPDDKKENYIMLAMGTGGNANPKIFFKKTIDNKTKTVVSKKDNMNGWLRIEKKGDKISAFFRPENETEWEKTGEYEFNWLNGKLQVGLIVFANFAGEGPKTKPDIKAAFTQLKIDAI